MKKFTNYGVGVALGVITSVLLTVVGVYFFLALYYYTQQESHYKHIQLAKSQELLLSLLLLRNNVTTDAGVNENREAFAHSLQLLKYGGSVDSVTLKPAEDQEIIEHLGQLEQHWKIYENISTGTVVIGLPTTVATMQKINKQLLKKYTHIQATGKRRLLILTSSLIGCILMSLGAAWLIVKRTINKPVSDTLQVARQAAVGDLSQLVNSKLNNEIGQIAHALDIVIQNQVALSEFAEKIGDGQFSHQYQILGQNDKLGIALTGMRDKLQKVSIEDKKRAWTTEGLAKFAEILRNEHSNIQTLSETIVTNLVKYLRANQGAIFTLEGEEKQLELASAYAWDRQRYLKKVFQYGEGLIGQSVIEGDTLYITDVPEQYINITSGLGGANPKSILIVPLKVNEETYGALEIASFLGFEKFEIEFVEKLAESIAATISSVKINNQTQKLLDESRRMNNFMLAQEEQMRQNLEEMQATQEEMQRKEAEIRGLFTSINNTLATIEFDLQGIIVDANDTFCQLLHYPLHEIRGKHYKIFIDSDYANSLEYKEFWQELRNGTSKNGYIKHFTKDKREVWLNCAYTPVLDKEGSPHKIIKLAQDVTAEKLLEIEAQKQAEELREQREQLQQYTDGLEDLQRELYHKLEGAKDDMRQQIQELEAEKAKNIAILEGCVDGVVSFNHRGNVGFFNQAAEEIWGISRKEILGRSIRQLLPVSFTDSEDGEFTNVAFTEGDVEKPISIRTEISFLDKRNEEISVLVTLSKAEIGSDYTFTFFIQKISVDLF